MNPYRPLLFGLLLTALIACGGGGGSQATNSVVSNANTPAPAPAPAPAPIDSNPHSGLTYYISPTGDDTRDGRAQARAWKTFAHAFSLMHAGDELILLDGTYSEVAGTGYISYLGAYSGQIPSGNSLSDLTIVRALNPGKVSVIGELWMGRSFRKDSFIKVQGISFENGGALYNTAYDTIKDCGFHGAFGVGTNDHENGNSNNLIEDVWIWAAEERVIAINYRADYNVWRRVLVRGDGCTVASCLGSGNPNVGISVYDSNHVSFQNVMVVDRILGGGDAYADFAVAQHTPNAHLFGANEWLGALSLNAPDTAFYFEPDQSGVILNDTVPTIRMQNIVAWHPAAGGINIAREWDSILLENITVYATGSGEDGVRILPIAPRAGILRNVAVANAGRYGINSSYAPSYVDIYNSAASDYNQTSCTVACYNSNPLNDGTPTSLRYPARIESGSFLKSKGFGGADIGANIIYRYGNNGTHWGDTGYNALTTTSLWPWPNEARIQSEMCAGVTRGFCAAPSLTHYLWTVLGNASPY